MKTEQFKVVMVSKNTNSFGLYGVVLLAKSGTAFEVGMNSLSVPKRDEILTCDLSDNNKLTGIRGRSYEIPQKLPSAPPHAIKEVWGE